MARKRSAPHRSATRKPPDPHAEELRLLRRDPWCAAALRNGTPLDVVREAHAARYGRSPLERLGEVARELRSIETRRRELVAERSQLVDQLRREGQPWSVIADAAQVSRPTLIQAGAS